jgi:hypothetical protein
MHKFCTLRADAKDNGHVSSKTIMRDPMKSGLRQRAPAVPYCVAVFKGQRWKVIKHESGNDCIVTDSMYRTVTPLKKKKKMMRTISQRL